ncbi:ankyrin repeat domain-containing protein [Bosea sp. TWI1241]|uniref:ankyrin repeat domain-containing protein n=1 Tax=Bosea sp. TWI1241 TaxID=3148904 RepID=UPI00320A70DD
MRPAAAWLALALTLTTGMQAMAGDDLHALVAAGDLPGIERAIGSGAALDTRDGQGRTPLLLAVAENRSAIAKALLAAGADLNAQAVNSDTPWLLAGASGRSEIIAAMLPLKPDLTLRNRYGGNALIPACERAHVETVRLLLTSGIDVNHVNDLGWTCLLEIVILGNGGPRHQSVAKLVLAAGADPNLADRDGVTPLAHARQRGQDAVAALIAAAGGR